jgi:ABC-type bacteriocin/lantibiotic exporter with double-glycine peptidase domain
MCLRLILDHVMQVVDGKIRYETVKFRYPTRREVEVLSGLSLAIPSGKRIALVGPSGCGKSTLIQLLQRLYDPDEGNVVNYLMIFYCRLRVVSGTE